MILRLILGLLGCSAMTQVFAVDLDSLPYSALAKVHIQAMAQQNQCGYGYKVNIDDSLQGNMPNLVYSKTKLETKKAYLLILNQQNSCNVGHFFTLIKDKLLVPKEYKLPIYLETKKHNLGVLVETEGFLKVFRELNEGC